MSNKEASKIYEAIVESVINEVREDFENAGIDEQTLQDLRRNWQLRLSETKVSNFSWDDLNNTTQPTAPPPETTPNGEIVIKQETANVQSLNPTTGDDSTSTNINPDLDQGLVLPGFDSTSIPQAPQNDDNNTTIKSEQTVLPDPNSNNNDDDNSNNEQSESNSEIQKPPIDTTNGQIELTLEDSNGSVEQQLRLQEKKAKRSALLDTDEVGSELDDSDDDYLISEGEDDGPDENLMLCLYDKVTRTKARWKCSLKDGIVTINHKDYTFQKAQVEAEWV
ncbi:transcription initiation factor IIA large subunit [Monosporozyma unispora]|nr:transcription factor IIA subunit alpha [Kazachstania unispora]